MYLDANCLLSSTQSGFRRVLSDLLDAVDRGDTAMLVLLDLSMAFDTADLGILLERLRIIFGVDNSAPAWFRSYLARRQQHVRCGGKCSALTDVNPVSAGLLPMFKNIPLFIVLPQHSSVTILHLRGLIGLLF